MFDGKTTALWKLHDSLRIRGHDALDPRVVDLSRLPGYAKVAESGIPPVGLSVDLAFRLQLIFFITGSQWGYATIKLTEEAGGFEAGNTLNFNFSPYRRDITYDAIALVEKLRSDDAT
jgi:hypothetical protein